MKCRICSSPADMFAKAVILGKYDVSYYKCGDCGFVQTEEPFWLAESYSDAIANSDIGLVGRNLTLSRLTRAIIGIFFDGDGRFLDYGGGYGLFVRLMRDLGLDFQRYDKHCTNIFAQGFDACMGDGDRYELLTAFEVFEHLVNPLEEIERMLELTDNILFSTELVPEPCPSPGDWWYYGMDHGQHISFFTRKALSFIAEKHGLHLYTSGCVHLFTRKKMSPLFFRVTSRAKVGMALSVLFRRESLLHNDWLKSLGKL